MTTKCLHAWLCYTDYSDKTFSKINNINTIFKIKQIKIKDYFKLLMSTLNPGQKISMVNLGECNDNTANISKFSKSISYVCPHFSAG